MKPRDRTTWTADDLWPRSSKTLTAEALQALSDQDFTRLLQLIKSRIIANGGSGSHAKRIVRRLQHLRNPPDQVRVPKRILAWTRKDHEILDSLVKNRCDRWIHPRKRRKTSEINLDHFSFIDYPHDTLEKIHRIALAECEALSAQIHFVDEWVLDIAPYLILALMRPAMAPFPRGGRITRPIMKVIEAVGLKQYLDMSFGQSRDLDDVWAFPLRVRRRAGTSTQSPATIRPSTKEKAADELVAAIEHWLGNLVPPIGLTRDGKGYVSRLATETLDNAERHSHQEGDGDWAVAGFMARRPDRGNEEDAQYVCHLAFVSIGWTIAESISHCDDQTHADLTRYCRMHPRSNSETLSTVFALQDGISRFPQGPGLPHGGIGIMDVVEFANAVGKSARADRQPAIAIWSGNTCVLFRDPYRKGVPVGGNGPRLQWFNEANSLDYPPDPHYVFRVPQQLPGTVVSVRFTVDASLLGEVS